MKGQQTHEYVVPFSATDVWEVYSTLELPQLIKKIPNFLEDIEVHGDGSVGTLFTLVVPPGGPFRMYREKIVTLDHPNMVKEVDVISGGVLDFGYTSFRTRFEIRNLGPTTSMIRSIILFEISDAKAAENAKLANVTEMEPVAKAVGQYLLEKRAYPSKLVGEQSFDMDVPHSAAAVWDVYSTLKLPELFKQLIRDITWQGDGSVGTMFSLFVDPSDPVGDYRERIVTLDQQRRVKEVDVIENGVLNKDFTFFRTRFEIIPKGPNATTIRSIIKYELNPKSATAAANMQYANVMDMKGAGDATNKYLTNLNQGRPGGPGTGGGSGQRPSGGWGEPEFPPPATGGANPPPTGSWW
ncbi:hypothetical protein H6P81_005352 [Aristolochia fimbriata]|uniref:Bet v I/Major latex protein domain-containing protein n=1 Tax=Aristolochia fimbriata TaxID=158543 RepID=A0AAV7EYP6_ARIFI|nr:hypothetical protein H6P81_005352 [Aristolochia fimbriata]